jgi:hypothetical protein
MLAHLLSIYGNIAAAAALLNFPYLSCFSCFSCFFLAADERTLRWA